MTHHCLKILTSDTPLFKNPRQIISNISHSNHSLSLNTTNLQCMKQGFGSVTFHLVDTDLVDTDPPNNVLKIKLKAEHLSTAFLII